MHCSMLQYLYGSNYIPISLYGKNIFFKCYEKNEQHESLVKIEAYFGRSLECYLKTDNCVLRVN